MSTLPEESGLPAGAPAEPERPRRPVDPGLARRYERIKLIVTLVNTGLSIIVPLVFLLTGGSEALRDFAEDISTNPWVVVLVYVLVISLAFEVITFPLDLYSGYVVERQFGLSRAGLMSWLQDWGKGQALQILFLLAAIEAIYALLRVMPGTWWLIAAAGFTLFFVVLAALAPVLLFRLFFKFDPLPDGELRERLMRLSQRLGVPVRGVYVWHLGEKTRKANAALAGWGRTRRILISDTLIQEHTPDEIEVVMAHEMAHQAHNDIWRGLAIQTALVFVAFYAVHLALEAWTESLGLRSVSDTANLPLLLLVSGAVTLVALPVANTLSRRMEHAADAYALEKTGLSDALATSMEKLAEQNLSQKRPNRLVEVIFHSHPSVQSRIEFARGWKGAQAG